MSSIPVRGPVGISRLVWWEMDCRAGRRGIIRVCQYRLPSSTWQSVHPYVYCFKTRIHVILQKGYTNVNKYYFGVTKRKTFSKLDLWVGGSFSNAIFNSDIQLFFLLLFVFYISVCPLSLFNATYAEHSETILAEYQSGTGSQNRTLSGLPGVYRVRHEIPKISFD